MPTALTAETIVTAPKVLLHDHLDGGLRPATLIDLADRIGYRTCPPTAGFALARWFAESAYSGSLERYLETFTHTLAVMQTRESLIRVASECVQDLAADGVVYAEVRFAPELHTEQGLALDEVVRAVLDGVAAGTAAAAAAGHRIRATILLTAMRHAARSREIAELCIAFRDEGVAGFDIAGAEAGFPPTRHLDAFEYLRRENAHFTIHAGEGVRPAVDLGGAAVVRRRPARARGADRRRHHGATGTARASWAGWRPTCGTSGSRWRWRRRRTCRPGRPRRSPSTRSGCWRR